MGPQSVSGCSLKNAITGQSSVEKLAWLLNKNGHCSAPPPGEKTEIQQDLCLKILREDKNCPGSLQVVRWIQGSFDALEKKYLRMAILTFYTNPKDPESVTELYQFNFRYTSNGPQMDLSSEGMRLESITRCQEIKNASTLLTRKLYMVMQNLGPLPNDVTMTMKLFYYNDVTPNDYQPSGFKEGNSSDMMFEGDPVHLKVGSVSTGHHTMKVKVTTESDRTMAMDNKLMQENIMEENSMEISHEGLDCEEEEEHVEDHLGHLEFSCSQEEGIGPRKRKVSEPEMDLTANKH
ncbi:HORMA domain-containing protein 2 isoform X2 [Lissotriton helveticus]